jgi:hypothetical protein
LIERFHDKAGYLPPRQGAYKLVETRKGVAWSARAI